MAEKITAQACFDKVKTKGRPRLVLNDIGKAMITNLAMIHCTDEEIALCLGVTVEVLLNKQNKEAFLECLEKGKASGKSSLRRIQFELAKKNATMAIWLGKQWLGQTEDQGGEKDKDKQREVIFRIVGESINNGNE